MAKCTNCNGTGIVGEGRLGRICGRCKGIGFVDEPRPKKPMTEQEYLQTCNAEQLAEALLNIMANNEFTLYLLHTEKKSVQEIKGAVVEWLKQPHNSPK